jgi:hypothetical protein
MTDKQRRSALFLALVGVAAWSVWLAVSEPANDAATELVDVAEPAARIKPLVTATTQTTAVGTSRKSQETSPRLALANANLFPKQTWFIPPPPPTPPPPPPPPPPPQAPPLPFSYMGRWQESGETTYYLARGAMPVSVRAGQVLDGTWRLEPVTGSMLNFTYLPLNQTRSLRTGD